MAEVHGVAGEWARVKGTVLGLWPLFVGAFAAGFSAAVAVLVHVGVGSSLFVLSLLWIGCTLLRGLRRVERFFKGARGEERVAGILKDLPAGYHVFNDFVAGRAHVDHVVVGPAGVFAVETKFWRGRVSIEDGHVLVDGQLPSREPIAQALREAAQVRGRLSKLGWTGRVTPVLAFASDTFSQHVVEQSGAVVMNAAELGACFLASRAVMPQAEVDRLVGLIESEK